MGTDGAQVPLTDRGCQRFDHGDLCEPVLTPPSEPTAQLGVLFPQMGPALLVME
jgi:hypothetical protein